MRTRGTVKGVVNSVETMLLIAATIAIALVALYFLATHVVAQASSSKSMISVSDAQGWYYGPNNLATSNPGITVTIYVTNIGDTDATIKYVKVLTTNPACYYEASFNVKVKPGETVPVSGKLDRKGNCNGAYIPSKTIVHIEYDADGRKGTVDQPIMISAANS